MGEQAQFTRFEKNVLPLCVALFTGSVLALIGQYSTLLYQEWVFPNWLFVILPIVALVSVSFSAFIHSPRTPFLVHLFEIGTVIAVTGIIIRLTGLETSYPWYNWRWLIQDPTAMLSLLLVLATWFLAGGYGNQFVKMRNLADQLGDQAASTVTWEYESLTGKMVNSTLPIEYFFRRIFGLAGLIGILAIATARSSIIIPPGKQLVLGILGTCGIISGLSLQGVVYFFRLQTMWKYADIKPQSGFIQAWLKNLLIFSLVVALLIMIIPVNFSPIKYDHVAGFVIRLIARLGTEPDLDLGFGAEQPAPIQPDTQPWDQIEQGEISFISALLWFLFVIIVAGGIGVMMLAVLGLVLVAIIKNEVDRLRGLPLLAVQIYKFFAILFHQWWQALRALGTWGRVKWQDYTHKQKSTNNVEEPSLAGHARSTTVARGGQDVRHMFRTIVKTGKQFGITMHTGQTPRQYGQELQKRLSKDEDIASFFDTYHQVRYSQRNLGNDLRQKAVVTARHIVAKIQRIGQGE